MLKRITSISLVLIMAFAMAAPILHIDCSMPCCEAQEMTCCDKKMDIEIPKAKEEDYQKAKHTIYLSGPNSTFLELPILKK